MNKKLIAFLSILLLSQSLPPIPVNAAVKAGEACKKAGITSVVSSKTFTCVKSGNKLVWNKGVTGTVSSPVNFKRDWNSSRSTDLGYLNEYNGWFVMENDLDGKLKDIQTAYYKHMKASGIMRLAKYELGVARPNSALTNNLSDLSTINCQVGSRVMSGGGFLNFLDSGRRDRLSKVKVPGPNMVVQVIPIFTTDSAKPLNSPKDDYGVYLDYIESWARYSSDGDSNIQIRVPEKYLPFSQKLANYDLKHKNNHDNPENIRFANQLISDVDSNIDFSGANAIMVIVPPGTSHSVFKQTVLKTFSTNEGFIYAGLTQTPFTLSGLDVLDSKEGRSSGFIMPYAWLHEFYHGGYGLPDRHGDPGDNNNPGMGEWTLMSMTGGDLSAWEKWMMGFITDSQVHCLNTTQQQIRWIAPSSVKTKEKKLIVIPLSQTKAIIIESIRPAGLYYKITKESNGVLVYVADFEIMNQGLELGLVLPNNRNPDQGPTWLSQATFRQGESVVSNGHRITIVESGNFGDVVKVEKVA